MIHHPRFTYAWYSALLDELKRHYAVVGYRTETDVPNVILRHDIDNSVEKAEVFARIECDAGVGATYFVMVTNDMYNPASRRNAALIERMAEMGHEIGLHFDEMAYPEAKRDDVAALIRREAEILSNICGRDVTTVSMHRPSRATIDANIVIPGMTNAYDRRFVDGYKYVSDSRRHWREPIEEMVSLHRYDRLHILTHAFWYNETELSAGETLERFMSAARTERYAYESDNIRDLEELIGQ